MSNEVTVELFYDTAWNDITEYVLVRELLQITRGLADEAVRADPQTLTLTLNNRDGRFSSRNPLSPLYGKIGLNTQIRVTCNGSVRFVGEVAAWPPRWNLPGTDVWVPVEAAGITRRLGQSGALRSPLYRSMIGVAPDDYVPYAYWPMIDGTNATQFGSALPSGRPMPIAGTVAPASDDTLTGSESLPVFSSGASARAVVPDYTDTSQWNVQFVMKVSTEPVGTVVLAEIRAAGTAAIWYIELVPGSPSAIQIRVTTFDGTAINSASSSVTESTFYGEWFLVTVRWLGDGAMVILDPDASFPPYAFPSFELVGSPANQIKSITLKGGVDQVAFGHLAVYTDVNFGTTQSSHNAEALDGFAGETAGRRMERLCREESITFTSVGDLDDTTLVGPQRTGTLLDLLDDYAMADAGILYEPSDSLGLVYRTRASRYSQAVDLALDYAAGYVSSPLDPVEDDQGVVNDLTIARDGGSSARYELTTGRMSTQDPPDGIGRVALSETHNLYSDDQCIHHASWRVNVSAVDEERYPSVIVDLSAAANEDETALITSATALDVGDRITIDNLPSWLAGRTADQVALGYGETIGEVAWKLRLNCSPASPYNVGVYGSASTVSRYGSANSTLTSDITSSATSVSVDSGGDTWVTGSSPVDSPTFPLGVKIGGLVYECTAISGSSPTYTLTITRLATDRAHAAGTPVEVADVGRYAL